MRLYCRPAATPLERLEAHLAFRLVSHPETPRWVAELLVVATGAGADRSSEIRRLLDAPVPDQAEALGMARAALLLLGAAPEREASLTGDPREDLERLAEEAFHRPDRLCPDRFCAPSLLDAYCHMGAGFARGVDAVFKAATGRTLGEHLRRALLRLDPQTAGIAAVSINAWGGRAWPAGPPAPPWAGRPGPSPDPRR